MTHSRKLSLGGAALTKTRNNKHTIPVMQEIQDDLEQVMISTGYLDNAPFKWITLMLRYGLKNDAKPVYQRINKKYGDLPIAIELDTHELQDANREMLKRLFMIAILKSLIDVGKKYNLPTRAFEDRLEELRHPNE